MIYQCSVCGSRDLEAIDTDTGEFLPEWLVDARKHIINWDIQEEPGLLDWQSRKCFDDEAMQIAVDGIRNSDRQSGRKPKGYAVPHKAIQTWVRKGYGNKPQVEKAPRYPARGRQSGSPF